MTATTSSVPAPAFAAQVWDRLKQGRTAPILVVLACLIVVWYAAAVMLNKDRVVRQLSRGGAEYTTAEMISAAWSMDRPVLPTPIQIGVELWETTVEKRITSKRSLIFHAGVTLGSTLVGFLMGTALGILLAVGIVHVTTLDRSLMPWIIASQTIPILAIAPMVVVVLGNMGFTGLIPKSVISAYLSFFPVTIGMVKGLRSPDPLQLDLLRTYSAGRIQVFAKLRWPSSIDFLFPSLKIAIALSLVGAIVGELPTGAQAGIGAKLLLGSYYGQMTALWAALFMAAFLAMAAVGAVTLAERLVLKARGGQAWTLARTAHLVAIPVAVGLAVALLIPVHDGTFAASGAALLLSVLAIAILFWFAMSHLAQHPSRMSKIVVPLMFGGLLLYLWEVLTVGFEVPPVLLPPPSMIAEAFPGQPVHARCRLPPDLHQIGHSGLPDGLWRRLPGRRGDRPLALPAARAAAAGQRHQRHADRRHRADHGDVVRLRLAVQGGRGGRHDLLPHADQHPGRAAGIRCHGTRPDALLRRKLSADPAEAAAAGGHALRLQRAEAELHPGPDRRHRGGVLRHADPGHGIPNLHRGGAAETWISSGRPSRWRPMAGSASYGALAMLERGADFLASFATTVTPREKRAHDEETTSKNARTKHATGEVRPMKKKLTLLAAGAAMVLGSTAAQALDDFTIQLKWVTQAQFAGYFVALEKGFLRRRRARRHHQAGRPGHRAAAGHRGRRRRRRGGMDAGRPGGAGARRAPGQRGAVLQSLRHDADLPEGQRHLRAGGFSRTRRWASGSSATNIRSCPG